MNLLVTDQMGRQVSVPTQPLRIVSLVPSQTELLYALGLGDEVVGITKFCIHPKDWFRNKPRIGGTKKVNHEAIDALNPDLIIGNKEENSMEDIQRLSEKYPVWMSDIFNLNDALKMIENIGDLTNKVKKAQNISEEIKGGFTQLKPLSKKRLSVLYLIWKKPFIAAGRNTFINDMIEKAGYENCIQDSDSRYPEIDLKGFESKNPDLVFLSSEPYHFKKSHLEDLKLKLPTSTPILVDGEMFSWYGSRLIESPKYFHNLSGTVERLLSA